MEKERKIGELTLAELKGFGGRFYTVAKFETVPTGRYHTPGIMDRSCHEIVDYVPCLVAIETGFYEKREEDSWFRCPAPEEISAVRRRLEDKLRKSPGMVAWLANQLTPGWHI